MDAFNENMIIVTIIMINLGSSTMYFVYELFFKPIKDLSKDIKYFNVDKLDKRTTNNHADEEYASSISSFEAIKYDTIPCTFIYEENMYICNL